MRRLSSTDELAERWSLEPGDEALLVGLPDAGKLGLVAQLSFWRCHGAFPDDWLALFAREAGASRDRIIILALDGAGWHRAPLAVPEGIRLVHLLPYTPELQPAETLWVNVDEPIVNRHFDTLADLDAVVAARCFALAADRDLIRGQAGFHWWPDRVAAN